MRIFLACDGTAARTVRRRDKKGPRYIQLLLRDIWTGINDRNDGRHGNAAIQNAFQLAHRVRTESDGGIYGSRIPHHAGIAAAAPLAAAFILRGDRSLGRSAARHGHNGRSRHRDGVFHKKTALLENVSPAC